MRALDFAAESFGPDTPVFIEKRRIRWIDAEKGSQLPPETMTVDGEKRFTIPGLFDMSAHEDDTIQEAFLAYGVTSIRDTGSRR